MGEKSKKKYENFVRGIVKKAKSNTGVAKVNELNFRLVESEISRLLSKDNREVKGLYCTNCGKLDVVRVRCPECSPENNNSSRKAMDPRAQNVYIPLPPGSAGAAYMFATNHVINPALESFSPDFILVSCGFDASYVDPLGRMMLGSKDFYNMTTNIVQKAEQLCNGRVVLAHEGGYSIDYVPYCGLYTVAALMGI